MQTLSDPLVTNDREVESLAQETANLVRGAGAATLAKFGKASLTELRNFLQAEVEAAKDVAQAFKTATNSALSVDALVALGPQRLAELCVQAGIQHQRRPSTVAEAFAANRAGAAGTAGAAGGLGSPTTVAQVFAAHRRSLEAAEA